MAGMVRSGRASSNVIWLDLRRGRRLRAASLMPGLAAIGAFALLTGLAANFLAEAIVAWIGHDRAFALSLISASSFL
ncbi:hypothetical protein [Methylocystis sp. S23]